MCLECYEVVSGDCGVDYCFCWLVVVGGVFLGVFDCYYFVGMCGCFYDFMLCVSFIC